MVFPMVLGLVGWFLTQSAGGTVLRIYNGGEWGDWGVTQYCPKGSYAVGYSMKIEQHGGTSVDDTALNGIRLICKTPLKREAGSVTSSVGPWGGWTGEVRCRNGYYLKAFSLQVEGQQGTRADDTTANFVKFRCRNKAGTLRSDELAIPPGRGKFGSYGGWSSECPLGEAICGIITKVELPQGPRGDDTALNNVRFVCCT